MRLLILVAILAAGAGCEWFLEDDGPRFTEATALTAPWDGMALPIDGAKVTFSDGETVSVHHPDAAADALAKAYGAALGTAGWTMERDTSGGGIVTQTWTKGADSLALSIQEDGGVRIVSLSILPF